MQEQRRLQESGYHVAPQNDPIKLVQLAGIFEGVIDERNEAEDVEMEGARSRPPSQEDVHPNAEVDEGNKAKPIICRAVGRFQHDNCVKGNASAEKGIRRLGPHAFAVNLSHQSWRPRRLLALDGGQLVPYLDASTSAGAF